MTAYTDQANTLGATQVYGVDFADTEWKDESGNGLHLTRTGATTEAGPGDGLDTALSCDGVDDWAHRSDEAALEIGATHTVCYWVKRNGTISSFAHEVGKGNDSWYTRDRSDGHEWAMNGGNSIIQEDVGDLAWHFVVIRQDDGANTRVLRSYGTDGVQLDTEETGVSVGAPNTVQWDFSVGAQDHDGPRRFYNGAFAGVAVFDGTALTDAEIDDLLDSTFEAGGGGVEVELTPASIALSAQALDLSLTALETELAPVSLATSAQALTPVRTALEVELTPVSLGLSAQALDLALTALETELTPASMPLVAQALTPVRTALEIELSPVSLGLSAQALDLGLTALETELSPATLQLVAQALTPDITGAGIQIELSPATLALSAQALDLSLTALSVELTPVTMGMVAQALDLDLGALAVELVAASMGVSAQALTPELQALAVQLAPALLNLEAQVLSPPAAAVQVSLVPASLSIDPQTLEIVIGSPSIPSGSDLAAVYRRSRIRRTRGWQRPPSWR